MKNFEFYFTGQPLTSTTHAVTGPAPAKWEDGDF